MTALAPMPLASHRKQFKDGVGSSSTPSYSPDLAPSNYHLFGFVKDQLHGQCYETTEAIQKAVRQCLRMAGTEFYRRGIFKLPERWEKCVQKSGNYVEK